MSNLLSSVLRFDRKFFQVILVLAILVGSLALGRHPSTQYLLFFAALFAGIFLWLWTELGLVLLPVVALLVPFSISTGTYTKLNAAFLLSCAITGVWILKMLFGRQLKIPMTSVTKPALFLILIATLSSITGNIRWNFFAGTASIAAQLGGLAIYIFSMLLLIYTRDLITREKSIRFASYSFIGLGAVYMVAGYIPTLGFILKIYQNGSSGSLFWIWLVALSAGQALYNTMISWKLRSFFLIITLLTLSIGWSNRTWASGWIPPLIAFLVLITFRNPRLGLIILVITLFFAIKNSNQILFTVSSDSQGSLMPFNARVEAWRIVLFDVIKGNWFLGLGPSNYYHYTEQYSLLGYYVKFNSHNQYVDLIAQVGLLGTAMFFWMVVSLFQLSCKLMKKVEPGFARGYIYSCFAALIGMLITGLLGDWVLPFVYNIGFAGFRSSMFGWLFLGGLLALESQLKIGREDVTRI